MRIHKSNCLSLRFEAEGLNNRMKKGFAFIGHLLIVCPAGSALGGSGAQPIDRAHLTMTVYVYKTGILSNLAHNHEIEAPIEWVKLKIPKACR